MGIKTTVQYICDNCGNEPEWSGVTWSRIEVKPPPYVHAVYMVEHDPPFFCEFKCMSEYFVKQRLVKE